MVVCNESFPYKFHKRMAARDLEYVVFVLVEKDREQIDTDIAPTWWPKSVVFSHPMIRDEKAMNNAEWKNILLDIIERYYKLNGNSWWLQALLLKTFSNDEKKFEHLISNTWIENPKVTSIVKNKIKSNAAEDSKNSKLRIQEDALLKLLPQPVVIVYDVIKFGVISHQEDFLRKLNLMKADKLLVNRVRYKLRKFNSSNHLPDVQPTDEEKNRNLPLNGLVGKPKLKKCPVMSQCYVKLNTIEKKKTAMQIEIKKFSKEKTKISTSKSPSKPLEVNLSTSCLPSPKIVQNIEPPFVVLTPFNLKKSPNRDGNVELPKFPKNVKLDLNCTVIENFETSKKNKLKKSISKNPKNKKRYSDTTLLNYISPIKFYSSPIKNNLKKNKNKPKNNNIIKIKWVAPKLKMKM